MVDGALLLFKEHLLEQLKLNYNSDSSFEFKQFISQITPKYLKSKQLTTEDAEHVRIYAKQLILDTKPPREIIKNLKDEYEGYFKKLKDENTEMYICSRPKKDFTKMTLLVEAMLYGDVDTVKDLIKNGVDVNEPVEISHSKLKPIEIASDLKKYRSYFTVMLINAGAEFKDTDVLYNAVYHNDIPLVEDLITKYGCDVNQLNEDKICQGGHAKTPLSQACRNDNTVMINKLIELGADMDNWTAYSALDVAAACGSTNAVKLLLNKGFSVHGKNAADYTPLCYAAKNGQAEMVELLLDAGASINHMTDSSHQTPLMLALTNNHMEAAKKLIERGASVGYLGGFNALSLLNKHTEQTPLHLEVEKMIKAKLQQQAMPSKNKIR